MGAPPKTVEPITGSGSNRRYVRFTSSAGKSVIGVIGTSLEENHAFCYLSDHFCSQDLPVPRVLVVSSDGLRYLQEDLGARSLFDALSGGRAAGGRYSEEERELLRRTIAMLPALQIRGAEGLDFSHCYPQAEMDEMNVHFDLNYFKYSFLKPSGVDFHEVRLEREFQRFARDLVASDEQAFLYRDFQARNVMLDAAGNPHFIDFQGGRRGPVQYDLASFLWQASARYSPELREELIGVYLENLRHYVEVDEARFRQRLRLFVLFRLLQVLGAYGYRGFFERKQHFLDSIPPALDNLRVILQEEDGCPYEYMRGVLEKLAKDPPPERVQPEHSVPPSSHPVREGVDTCDPVREGAVTFDGRILSPSLMHSAPSLTGRVGGGSPLLVRIFSFSYKRGIPEDTSGNGGGYVFDCRSTHNPGRYEPYKQLTGLDEPVIRFLEEDGEILTFLDSVYRLADAHVERYLQRGFTDLMFSFGCTGGQHRSVYSAQHLAEHLHDKYGIVVDLTHREQHIHTILK